MIPIQLIGIFKKKQIEILLSEYIIDMSEKTPKVLNPYVFIGIGGSEKNITVSTIIYLKK